MEFFNGIIISHARDNPNLVYAILGAHHRLEQLGTFTLLSGLREIKRAQDTPDTQVQKADTGSKVDRQDLAEKGFNQAYASEHLNHSEIESRLQPQAQEDIPEDIEPIVGPSSSSPKSEKSRGKMKERRSSSVDVNLEYMAANAVGRNGFVPTQEWVRTPTISKNMNKDLIEHTLRRSPHGNKGGILDSAL